MSEIINEIRKGFYLDSVALMRLSAEITASDGIEDAVLMIGTPSNIQIMRDAGVLNSTGETAGPNDLVIALRAASKASGNRALALANKSLEGGALKSSATTASARTLRGELTTHTDANLALISTPGSYAAREARSALEHGLNVMIFSDNVSLEQEASLKRLAQQKELIVMGPDCGTAYINGVPLAFANALALPSSHPDLSQGTTAVIAASGTGLQEFAVLFSMLGGVLKHGIGVGGRDLSDDIGGISTLTAIDLLAKDSSVDQIVLISKPPGNATAKLVFDKLSRCGKSAIACVFGQSESAYQEHIQYASTLRETAELASGKSLPRQDTDALADQLTGSLNNTRKNLTGLYTGGTLCTETQLILQRMGLTTSSNAPVPGSAHIDKVNASSHQIIDLGADEYTVGRPHPMMEPLVRIPILEENLHNPDTAVILLDLVLGYGAHNNPVQAIAEAVQKYHATNDQGPVLIASVCGTEYDPQKLHEQQDALLECGITVCNCNTAAAELAAAIINRIA